MNVTQLLLGLLMIIIGSFLSISALLKSNNGVYRLFVKVINEHIYIPCFNETSDTLFILLGMLITLLSIFFFMGYWG